MLEQSFTVEDAIESLNNAAAKGTSGRRVHIAWRLLPSTHRQDADHLSTGVDQLC